MGFCSGGFRIRGVPFGESPGGVFGNGVSGFWAGVCFPGATRAGLLCCCAWERCRAYCAWYNFSGGDQQKKVGVLSGGERNRLGFEFRRVLSAVCVLLLHLFLSFTVYHSLIFPSTEAG